MKCSYCGASVEKGRLFCLNCGEEMEWVREYNAIGSYRTNHEHHSPNQPNPSATPPEASQKQTDAEGSRKKHKKKKSPLIVGCVLLIVGICALLGFKYYMDQKHYNSFDYQINMAETEYSNGEYQKAYEYIARATLLEPESANAILLEAQILLGQKNTDAALSALIQLLELHPDNIMAYGQIIRIYETQNNPEKIKELLANCQETAVLERYQDYITEKPVFGLPSGEYDDIISIELHSDDSDNSVIYYTTNGATPTQESSRYYTGIKIGEGTTHLKAISISNRGIVSDIAEGNYKVKLVPPNPPKISPPAGEFTKEVDTKIYVIVPEGCTAYYSYDAPPTTESTRYMEPIEMPEGEHTFYAILVDKNGKQSETGSAQYNLTK